LDWHTVFNLERGEHDVHDEEEVEQTQVNVFVERLTAVLFGVFGAFGRVVKGVVSRDRDVPEYEQVHKDDHYPMEVELALLLGRDLRLLFGVASIVDLLFLDFFEEIFD